MNSDYANDDFKVTPNIWKERTEGPGEDCDIPVEKKSQVPTDCFCKVRLTAGLRCLGRLHT